MQANLIKELSIGTELEIANAARKSFDNQHEKFSERDKNLIKFLIREKHWLPFRHPQLSFECEVPIFIARQLGKHQVGLSWSETSRRYKTSRIKFYNETKLREDNPNRKQGEGKPTSNIKNILGRLLIKTSTILSYTIYKLLLSLNIAPEQAREILPQNMYVYFTWTGSLLAWIHLCNQRTHKDSQKETRDFVTKFIIPEIKKRFPITYEQLVSEWNG